MSWIGCEGKKPPQAGLARLKHDLAQKRSCQDRDLGRNDLEQEVIRVLNLCQCHVLDQDRHIGEGHQYVIALLRKIQLAKPRGPATDDDFVLADCKVQNGVIPMAPVEHKVICTCTAVQNIVADLTNQGVVPLAAIELIPAVAADKLIAATASEQTIRAQIAKHCVPANTAKQTVIAIAALHQIIAEVTDQEVAPCAAEQAVIAIPTKQFIAAVVALDGVIAALAPEGVIA